MSSCNPGYFSTLFLWLNVSKQLYTWQVQRHVDTLITLLLTFTTYTQCAEISFRHKNEIAVLIVNKCSQPFKRSLKY